MAQLVRFGISLEMELLYKFDALIKEKKYNNRSEAIRDLIRADLVKKEWKSGKNVAGTLTLVYDHHKRDLVNRIVDIQHHNHRNILSTQHIHLDDDNCLEIVVVKGKPIEIEELHNTLKSVKGVKHAGFIMTTMGREVI